MMIKMLGTHRGSESNGIVRQFHKNDLLIIDEDITDSLARAFLHNGWATQVNEEAVNKLIASPYFNCGF